MSGNERAGGRILGSLGSADGKGVVRMQDRFGTVSVTCGRRSPIPRVWPAGMAR